MKKSTVFVYTLSTTLLLSSCGSYTATGAYTGSTIGSILGSAIGGLSDGPRGSDIGTLIGMAGGAVIGGAIGNAADKEQQRRVEEYHQRTYERSEANRARTNEQRYQQDNGTSDSGFDPTNSGDDRIYDYNDAGYNSNYSVSKPYSTETDNSVKLNSALDVKNVRFVDNNMDNAFASGETCKIIFEVRNTSSSVLYDVQPIVEEVSGNKHIVVSPGIHVEQILPGKGIRYTAMVKADNRLKDGSAQFRIYAVQGDNQLTSRIHVVNVATRR